MPHRGPCLSKPLLVFRGEESERHTADRPREACTQAFTDGAMRMYLPTVLDVVAGTLARWAAAEGPIKFYAATRSYAFDIAATVLTGTRLDGEQLGARARARCRACVGAAPELAAPHIPAGGSSSHELHTKSHQHKACYPCHLPRALLVRHAWAAHMMSIADLLCGGVGGAQ